MRVDARRAPRGHHRGDGRNEGEHDRDFGPWHPTWWSIASR